MDKELKKAAEDTAKSVEGIPGPFGDMLRSLMATVLSTTDEEARKHAASTVAHAERAEKEDEGKP